MAIKPDYVSGTVTLTNGSTAVAGTDTFWSLAPIRAGDLIFLVDGAEEFCGVVAADATENDELTLAKPWAGPNVTDAEYRIRFQPDGSRYSAASTQLIEEIANGNLPAFAALAGAAGKVPVFTGPGAMGLLNSTDLVNGVVYDKMVDDIAARAAYDAEAEGFAVLVADSGDGRSALYTKASSASGDWSDPAYITGPSIAVSVAPVDVIGYGEDSEVTIDSIPGGVELTFGLPASPAIAGGAVTTGAPGTSASASLVPAAGGYTLNLTIPRGEGFSFKGPYAGGTAYVKGDVVTYDGSSYIAKGATTGNLPTNAVYWDVLVVAGADGDDGEDGTSFVWRGGYNPVTAYVAGDAVSQDGSAYIAKGPTTGNAPPNATYWDVLAVKGTDGLDGEGLVNEIIPGDHLAVDNSDPTTPVVSLDFAVSAFAETLLDDADAAAARTTLGAQALDATLTALAGLNATAGLLVQTGTDAFTKRTLTGTANQIGVTNGDGVSGNPTLSLAIGNIEFGSWTPTLTNVANISDSNAEVCYYVRLGPMVWAIGFVSSDPVSASNTTTRLGISLPIPSNFVASTDLTGLANTNGPTQTTGAVLSGDATNDRAELLYYSTGTANIGWRFMFGYRII